MCDNLDRNTVATINHPPCYITKSHFSFHNAIRTTNNIFLLFLFLYILSSEITHKPTQMATICVDGEFYIHIYLVEAGFFFMSDENGKLLHFSSTNISGDNSPKYLCRYFYVNLYLYPFSLTLYMCKALTYNEGDFSFYVYRDNVFM